MRERGLLGRMLDGIVLTVILFAVLTGLFAAQTRNILWGAALALPVAMMGMYALRLWRRRRIGTETLARNARYHLQSLMLLPREHGLRKLSLWLRELGLRDTMVDGERILGTLEGKPVEARLVQKPLESRAGPEDVLAFYHAVRSPRGILVSTAPFTDAASIFARQCTGPRVALVGPDTLRPILEALPSGGEEPARDAKKRRQATLSQLKRRATDGGRQKRYLLYGTLMLAAYIVFNSWAFLVPGLVCVFLAVIAKRGAAERERLFPD